MKPIDFKEKISNLPIGEYTSPTPFAVSPQTPSEEILWEMKNRGIRHIPVVENDKPVGVISERDLIHLKEAQGIQAKDLMSNSPFCVFENTPLGQVAFEMSDKKIGSALVVDEEEKLIGVFTTTDALNALVEVLRGDIE